MKKLNARETVILIVTLVLAVFFALYLLVIKPMHERAMDINDRLSSAHDELLKARHLLAQGPLAQARYKNLVDLIGICDSEEAQMPAIRSRIDTAALATNVNIVNYQPQQAAQQKGASFPAVELEIEGQWLDIVHFLYLVQQQPDFYFINDLNLEKYSGEANTLRGRIVLSRMCLVNP